MADLPSALLTLSCTTARNVPPRAHGARQVVTIWCLLFTVSVFSATHFPDDRAADDALKTVETVVDDVPGEVLPATEPSKGFKRVIKVALGKTVKQPGRCFSVKHWVTHVFGTPDAPSTSIAAPGHPSDTPEL